MAINNGRYVTTGGYIDANGNIVEEKQWMPEKVNSVDHIMNQMDSLLSGKKTPEQIRAEDGIYPTSNGQPYSSPVFSNAEVYNLQSQGYANQGDTAMANAFGGLANDLGKYSGFANTSISTADSLLNYLKSNEAGLQSAAGKLYNQLTSDIENQRNYIYDVFGPNGTLTQEVNKYYDDLGDYLSTEAGRQAANIAAQGVHSGASLGAIRAQQNAAYNEAFGRYVQAKEQEINAKTKIATNLIDYISTLRKEYGDTTNQYIIELYKRANDMYNKVASSLASDIDQINSLRYTSSGSGGSSSSSTQSILDSIFGNNSNLNLSGLDNPTSDASGGISNPANQSGGTNDKSEDTDYVKILENTFVPLKVGSMLTNTYNWALDKIRGK